MKNLMLVMVLLSFNISANTNIEESAKEKCEEYHIEEIKYGSIQVFDITCTNEGETFIYQYVPEQLVTTHYVK